MSNNYLDSKLEAVKISDDLLRQAAIIVCEKEGLDFQGMRSDHKVVITHFCCSNCKLRPLYQLDVSHPKRLRCNICKDPVSVPSVGRKYGRIRKMIIYHLYKN